MTSIKKKSMIVALEKTFGIVSEACVITDMSRKTHYAWLKKDEKYRKSVEEVENLCLDAAESKLLELVRKSYPPAIFFYLKLKGRKRGYGDNPEPESTDNKTGFIWELKRLQDENDAKEKEKLGYDNENG